MNEDINVKVCVKRFSTIMRINAYVLAADPTWIQASVSSYYEIINTLVVCYDGSSRGWTGAEIPVQTCLDRLRSIDHAGKIRLLEGDYARLDHTPMENDLFQREQALKVAGEGADWVLMLDTDEVLPQPSRFLQRLEREVPFGFDAVEWPMRVLFQKVTDDCYLEVCTSPPRRQLSEYPGSIAVRPNVQLKLARHNKGRRWRFDFQRGLTDSVRCLLGKNPHVHALISPEEAIWHFSWVRSEDELRVKLASWGHSHDFDTESYLSNTWRTAPERWSELHDFHPIHRGAWPALRPIRAPAGATFQPHQAISKGGICDDGTGSKPS